MNSNRMKESAELQLIRKHQRVALFDSLKNESPPDVPPMLFDNKLSFSVVEAAWRLGVSPRSLERAIKRGEIRAVRLGRRVLIPKDELGAWLNRKD